MKKKIDPGRKRKSINFLDNIKYSDVKDLDGNTISLKMSIMLQNGNSEMKFTSSENEDINLNKKPALVWVPGGGYRGCDKNLMVSEMQFLAEAGYVVASIYYRSSAEGKAPTQIIDVKTAIRFLRAHADEYNIDINRIGILGRSAGAQLASLAAMNTEDFISEEWSDYSSDVQACYNMFGPTNFDILFEVEEERFKNPDYRWHTMLETHLGAVIGGEESDMKERAGIYTVKNYINENTAPMLISHGTADPLVPIEISLDLYDSLCEHGLEKQTDLLMIEGAGHGTDEFFQDETKKYVVEFFDKCLKNN